MTDKTFTREDFTKIVESQFILSDFEKFVLRRFAAYTRHTQVQDLRGRPVTAIGDVFARTTSGYGHWRVHPHWTNHASNGEHTVTVEHYVDDDRGGSGSVTASVQVPLAYIFDETENDAEYEQFMHLKARFEPDTGAVSPAPLGNQRDNTAEGSEAARRQRFNVFGLAGRKQSKARLEAARVLWVQSSPQSERTGNGEHLADPANRDQAAEAYQRALASLTLRTGMKDVRRSVHAAASTLGLTNVDLKRPKA